MGKINSKTYYLMSIQQSGVPFSAENTRYGTADKDR